MLFFQKAVLQEQHLRMLMKAHKLENQLVPPVCKVLHLPPKHFFNLETSEKQEAHRGLDREDYK